MFDACQKRKALAKVACTWAGCKNFSAIHKIYFRQRFFGSL